MFKLNRPRRAKNAKIHHWLKTICQFNIFTININSFNRKEHYKEQSHSFEDDCTLFFTYIIKSNLSSNPRMVLRSRDEYPAKDGSFCASNDKETSGAEEIQTTFKQTKASVT